MEPSPSKQFVFILRHGMRADKDPLYSKPYLKKFDPPLTDLGRKQCRGSAKHIKTFIPEKAEVKVYSSPFLRCLESAAEVCREVGCSEITMDSRLSEILATYYFRSNPICRSIKWNYKKEGNYHSSPPRDP